MKTMMSLVAILALTGGYAFAEIAPTVVSTAYHTGYIPDGFDTNDAVQFVGEGMFPNTCYRPAATEITVDHDSKAINVAASAYKYDGMCLQMIVPYHQVLDVGVLKAGTYDVNQAEQNLKLGALKVRVATNSSPDDYLYAPISQAYMQSKNGKARITISGEFTNSCMKLAQVLTHVQPKVVVVQPISELVDGPDCKEGNYPFEKQVDVNNIKRGRYLLHVRSLNAKSVNNLVDVQ